MFSINRGDYHRMGGTDRMGGGGEEEYANWG